MYRRWTNCTTMFPHLRMFSTRKLFTCVPRYSLHSPALRGSSPRAISQSRLKSKPRLKMETLKLETQESLRWRDFEVSNWLFICFFLFYSVHTLNNVIRFTVFWKLKCLRIIPVLVMWPLYYLVYCKILNYTHWINKFTPFSILCIVSDGKCLHECWM